MNFYPYEEDSLLFSKKSARNVFIRNRGANLIVVDPRQTKTALVADVHLDIRPGTDVAIANGLLHVMIEEDLVDHDFIQKHTTGFE
jgi:assimilatory nitrate reductase catalytic subunit